MIKLLHADNFFLPDDVEKLYNLSLSLGYTPKEHGDEIENFNYVIPDLDPIFSKYLAEDVRVVEEMSGIFRRPRYGIHFESFSTPQDWVFIVNLDPRTTTVNFFKHKSGAKSALDGYQFNYNNLFEWDLTTNIELGPNEGIIFRPWMFHSVNDGIIQVYRLTSTAPATYSFRECGDCTMCCEGHLYGEAFGKPFGKGQKCFYLQNKSCTVYNERPDTCKKYQCAWSQGIIDESLKPNKCGVLISVEGKPGSQYLKVIETDGPLKQEIREYLDKWVKQNNTTYTVVHNET